MNPDPTNTDGLSPDRLPLVPNPPPSRPCGKVSYPSLKAVRTAINSRTQGHQRNRPANGLRYYHCPQCGQFHISHKHRRP